LYILVHLLVRLYKLLIQSRNMPATPQPPYHRWGVRFTSDTARNLPYLQTEHDEAADFAYRGELFLNEALDEMYYVDSAGTARRFGDRAAVPFSRISFTGLREFTSDTTAAAATPPVAIGGMYRTGNVLKIRVV
jgi:hypothetical protein